jgi:hypothetical protein
MFVMPVSRGIRKHRWGYRIRTGGAAVGLVLVALAPAPAEAAVAPGAVLLPSNEAVAVVAGHLDDLGAGADLAGITVDEAGRGVTVHWKGHAPAGVHAYVAERPLGVTIRLVEGAKYSRVEGKAAAQRLANSALARQIDVQSVAVNPDGSGIRARVPGAAAMSANDQGNAAAVAQTAVTFETRAPIQKAATRYNDAPAWKGGIRTVQGTSACSTAFAVLVGSAGRLLSAHHCDESANLAVRDGAGQLIASGGASVAGIASIDSQLIDPSASPATTARVYTGAWNSSTTAVVKSWARNFIGQSVCASGATSGQHCGTITDDTTSLPWTSGNFFIEAKAAGSAPLIAGGDSGGPVFASVTGGVQARGVILAGSVPVTCGATNPDVDPPCYNYAIYAPISVVLDTWGVQLEVG